MHIVLYHSHDFGRSWGEPTTVPCAHPALLPLLSLVLTGVFSMAQAAGLGRARVRHFAPAR